MLAEKLGVPFDRIRLLQGDSDELLAGGGTGGSRSMYASGAAIVEGADQVIQKGKQIAGFVLEASAGDIEFAPPGASPSRAPTARSTSWNWPRSCAAD